MKFGVELEEPGNRRDVNRFCGVLLEEETVFLEKGDNKWGALDVVEAS